MIYMENTLGYTLIYWLIGLIVFLVLAFYLFKKLFAMQNDNSSFEEQLEYLSSQKSIAEANSSAYVLIDGGNYTNLDKAEFIERILNQASRLKIYLFEKYNKIIQGYFTDLSQLQNKLNAHLAVQLHEFTPKNIERKVAAKAQEEKMALEPLCSAKQDSIHEYNIFRGKHHISRPCEAEEKHNYTPILALFVFFEALFNLWFYRAYFGAIDSFLYALFISGANVVSGFFLGRFFRNIHLPHRRRLGYLAFVLAIVVIVGFMSIIAYFRLDLQDVIDSAFYFESFIVFIAGIFFGFFAFYKGYRSDDPIPGYGKIYRKKKRAELEFKEQQEKTIKNLNEIFQNNGFELERIKDEIKANLDIYEKLLVDTESEIQKWKNDDKSLNKKINSLVNVFKSRVKGLLKTSDIHPPFLENNDEIIEDTSIFETQKVAENYRVELDNYKAKSIDKLKEIDKFHEEYNDFRAIRQNEIIEELLRSVCAPK